MQARVTISNQGTQVARVILNNSALSLVEVEFEEGWPRFVAERSIGDTRYRGVSKVVHDYIDVGAGESYEVSYIFQVHKSGHYLVRFLAAMEGDHYDEFKRKVNAPLAMQYSTGADQYVVIP